KIQEGAKEHQDLFDARWHESPSRGIRCSPMEAAEVRLDSKREQDRLSKAMTGCRCPIGSADREENLKGIAAGTKDK
ncbi:MAG: hypothetical protein V3T76_00375, partial [candidate division NC10 bacterium]